MKWLLLLLASVATAANTGKDFKTFLECYTWWDPNSATRPYFSQLEGCDLDAIAHCKTDKGHDDVFCAFHGDNHLTPHTGPDPTCFFCCGMETCDSWNEPHSETQQQCVDTLTANHTRLRHKK